MNTYLIHKREEPVTDNVWENINSAKLDYEPWEEFPCPYDTTVKLLYTQQAIYVNFKTSERVLRAVNTYRDSPVSEDSCMEFFLSPNENDNHYINFEINPIGTLLVYKCLNRDNMSPIDVDDTIFDIKCIIDKSGWQLQYKIPFDFLREHFNEITPKMKGNFYKCGRKTIQRHYACWNPIKLKEPEFHCPQYFGKLILNDENVLKK